ncbi:response regulator [Pengzhenrongella sicca]|uniref:Response regulator transcription factor n=1 Tax=Pengzhenrongella sicca TaxID=2819238 RepID=A0A8A4ZHQ0_9MICO|nr:response regulator transcription factor [Pengzhenrongella sicca]QTE30499.1 response regulator transcription factor [Pengzhenrongella sicca]
MTIRVVLADDHDLFRSGLRAAVDTQADLECVADVGDGRAAIDAVVRLQPDVAVLDIRMPLMDGLEAAETLLADGAATRIILLTTYDDESHLYRALQAGVSGFCLKGMPAEEVLGAIRIAARGDALIDPSVTRRLARRFAAGLDVSNRRGSTSTAPPRLETLTAREHEVLLQMGQGLSNAEIARACFIGEETVKTHVSRVLAKLNLRDRVQAVVLVHEHGLNADTR